MSVCPDETTEYSGDLVPFAEKNGSANRSVNWLWAGRRSGRTARPVSGAHRVSRDVCPRDEGDGRAALAVPRLRFAEARDLRDFAGVLRPARVKYVERA